jgi:signal transduction histidine kinase
LTLFAEAAQENGRAGRLDLVQAQLEEIGGTSQQALKEMRLLLYELRAGALELEGLLVALRHRLDSVELRSGMSTHLSADTLVNVPTDMEQALLRIAVGALNNTLRHAEATAVNVSIRQLENTLRMEISDNGKGFDLAAAGRRGGMGLQIMRERAEAIKGQLKIETGPEAGTRIRIEVDTELVNHGH